MYTDKNLCAGVKIREFSENVDPEELKWHWDTYDRICIPLESNGWQFQYDNELPFPMEINKSIEIKSDEYHRIIKGNGSLKILIIEPELIIS
jgi:hypothetical protein